MRIVVTMMAAVTTLAALPAGTAGRATAQPTTPVQPDGGRAPAVHRIPLYHGEGQVIGLDDDPLLPFSTRLTCGRCHDYTKIQTGRHFNAGRDDAAAGRPGEPWILYDPLTATQAPLSYRPWPGAHRPDRFGLTPWLFTRVFGAYLPGGGVSEPEAAAAAAEPGARWFVSGPLEINCLHCHHADPAENPSEWAVQVSRQNFRWAAAAASDLAVVTGAAARAPDGFDPFLETNEATRGPRTRYDAHRFNAAGHVFFDLVRGPPPARCYACHTVRAVGTGAPDTWQVDGDVHLKRGLRCTDCHRNGLDHRIVRGSENANGDGPPADPATATDTLTCRGCHLGAGGRPGGRLGAPVPRHQGLPPVHLERLSCTACHAGPRPGAEPFRIQTSASHRIGVQGGYRGEDAPPYIYSPVFRRQTDGVIAPHRILWPSYWGLQQGDGTLEPLGPFAVQEAAGPVLEAGNRSRSGAGKPESKAAPEAVNDNTTGRADGTTPDTDGRPAPLTEDIVRAVLERLARAFPDRGTPVRVEGGRLYHLDPAGTLERVDHPAAAPYAWPIGHDVRPASESLGARSCDECHAPDAPFFFGRIEARTPGAFEPPRAQPMHTFQDLDPAYLTHLGRAFSYRDLFVWIALAACTVIALVILVLGVRAPARPHPPTSRDTEARP